MKNIDSQVFHDIANLLLEIKTKTKIICNYN